MPRVLLINPPTPFLAYPNAAPHLGIGYLISYLREHAIEATYLNLETADPDSVVLPQGYDFYGISAVSAQYYFARKLLAQIVTRNLGTAIIGGAHASVMPRQCFADGFTYVVKGYGETALLKIVCGKLAPGIIQGKQVENLDSLPFPAWDELLQSSYEISYGDRIAHMFSMRGCPYDCSYCTSAEMFGRTVSFRSIQNVLAEAAYLKEKYDITGIYFLDPTFTVNRRRAIELAQRMKELGLHWTCETRVDRIDEKVLDNLRDGGCDLISYGIETGAQEVHGLLGKSTSIEQNQHAIRMSHEAGLRVKAFLMGALPEDNWTSLETFKDFIHENKPDTWLFSTFIPFPGTQQWKDPSKFNIRIHCKDFRAYYNLGLNGRGPINISNQHLSRSDLRHLRDEMLGFLMTEVPNPRVETAMARFSEQRERVRPHFEGLEEDFLF
jgi:radical SAM superfamily enzyme YgiQ (UPF0313 family)